MLIGTEAIYAPLRFNLPTNGFTFRIYLRIQLFQAKNCPKLQIILDAKPSLHWSEMFIKSIKCGFEGDFLLPVCKTNWKNIGQNVSQISWRIYGRLFDWIRACYFPPCCRQSWFAWLAIFKLLNRTLSQEKRKQKLANSVKKYLSQDYGKICKQSDLSTSNLAF